MIVGKTIPALIMLTALVHSDKLLVSVGPSSPTLHPKPWKITERQFMDQYGKDDSSRALIDYYFERRKLYKRRAIIYTGISGVSGILGAYYESRSGTALEVILLGIPLFAALWFFGFGILIETARWIGMSRRTLFKILDGYKNGKAIPKRIRNKRRFQDFVKAEK